MSELFRLVGAWQEAVTKSKAAFEHTEREMRLLLAPLGNYATTTPDAKGYCMTFTVTTSQGWVMYPIAAAFRPSPPASEVGDQCMALENAWREAAMAANVARLSLRGHILRIANGTEPEDVALALYKEKNGNAVEGT